MFKQFIHNFFDSQVYLITSLWIFLLFFIAVAIMLLRTSKKHINYMSELPLNDNEQSA